MRSAKARLLWEHASPQQASPWCLCLRGTPLARRGASSGAVSGAMALRCRASPHIGAITTREALREARWQTPLKEGKRGGWFTAPPRRSTRVYLKVSLASLATAAVASTTMTLSSGGSELSGNFRGMLADADGQRGRGWSGVRHGRSGVCSGRRAPVAAQSPCAPRAAAARGPYVRLLCYWVYFEENTEASRNSAARQIICCRRRPYVGTFVAPLELRQSRSSSS